LLLNTVFFVNFVDMLKIILYISLFILGFLLVNYAQTSENESGSAVIYFDAILFRGDSSENARLDMFVVVPYQTLSFLRSERGVFFAKFQISLKCFDQNGNLLEEKTLDRTVQTNQYEDSQGLNANFDESIHSFYLQEGRYRINLTITDLITKNKIEKNREISVINYSKYRFSLSGMMLVSDIIETDGNSSITPFLSDNISNLENGFFVFFEAYNNEQARNIDFVYELWSDSKLIEVGNKVTRFLEKGTNQVYLKIPSPKNLLTGTYYLKVIALPHSSDTIYDESQYLAVSQRTIRYAPTLAGNVLENLDLAIRQLRYVATNSQIRYIEEGATYEQKLNRFREFWNGLDPNPNTKRNEAFEEYYQRVEYANSRFKSYLPGWQTDMGMVYIIFGSPASVDRRQDYYNPSRVYERWIYSNNREFIFVDNNGFGDFKLLSPTTVTEKYDYNRYR